MEKFNFDERMSKIEETLANLNTMISMSDGFVSYSAKLIETVENSLVVAIYSLSEQMLKHTVYSVLEVTDEEGMQTPKDIYILLKMPPSSHAMTPKLDVIKNQLKPYDGDFDIYIPKCMIVNKNAYTELIHARHAYAHGNNHTSLTNGFKDSIEFVKYLRAIYFDIGKQGFTKEIHKVIKEITNVKITVKTTFQHFINTQLPPSSVLDDLESLRSTGNVIVSTDEDSVDSDIEVNLYGIQYLDELTQKIEEFFRVLAVIDQENFEDKKLELILIQKELKVD